MNKGRNTASTRPKKARGQATLVDDEKAEAMMIGELYPRIINADANCESCDLEMHALEALNTPTAKALKRGLFTDLAWRRAFMAIHAAKRLASLAEPK